MVANVIAGDLTLLPLSELLSVIIQYSVGFLVVFVFVLTHIAGPGHFAPHGSVLLFVVAASPVLSSALPSQVLNSCKAFCISVRVFDMQNFFFVLSHNFHSRITVPICFCVYSSLPISASNMLIVAVSSSQSASSSVSLPHGSLLALLSFCPFVFSVVFG